MRMENNGMCLREPQITAKHDMLNKGFRGFSPEKLNVRKHIRCLLRLCHTRIQEE